MLAINRSIISNIPIPGQADLRHQLKTLFLENMSSPDTFCPCLRGNCTNLQLRPFLNHSHHSHPSSLRNCVSTTRRGKALFLRGRLEASNLKRGKPAKPVCAQVGISRRGSARSWLGLFASRQRVQICHASSGIRRGPQTSASAALHLQRQQQARELCGSKVIARGANRAS